MSSSPPLKKFKKEEYEQQEPKTCMPSSNANECSMEHDKDNSKPVDTPLINVPIPIHEQAKRTEPLTEREKEILQDSARCHDFFDWLEKYNHLSFPLLFSAFDATLSQEAFNAPIDELLPLLRYVMHKKIAKRPKRQDINTIEDVVHLLKTCQNIMVLTGAGTSVSCGIPDFRSKNGIYSRLDKYQLQDPQQLFDLEYFKICPETFYSFAKEIYPSNFEPSPSHLFIKLLQDKGKLLRNYTQNIDTLEQKAGITKICQCHGSFATAKCIVCGHEVPGQEIEEYIFNQQVPQCPKCPENMEGIMKPSITFFGEKLPLEFDEAFAQDRDKVDLLIVMGSSLKVSPVADIKDKIPHHVPQILINMESLPHMDGFDVQLLGYCDTVVSELCKLLEWELKHDKVPTTSVVNADEEDAKIYRLGSVPHRFLFEGGIERFIYESSSDDASEDEHSVDESIDSCDEESVHSSKEEQAMDSMPLHS